MIEALIFDVDGTLAETERDGHRIAFNRAFAAVGLDWHWDEALYGELLAVTGGKERLRHYWAQRDPEAAANPGTEAFVQRLHRLKTDFYTDIVARGGIPLRPGVQRLLHEAQSRRVRLAIATTTTPGNVSALLEATLGRGAAGLFEVIGAGDVVPAKKPAPDIYVHVLELLGVPPDRCAAVEDSEPGLAAAVAAGIPTLVTESEYTRGGNFAGAMAVVDALGEPDAPASGSAAGRPWRGVVDVGQIGRWMVAPPVA